MKINTLILCIVICFFISNAYSQIDYDSLLIKNKELLFKGYNTLDIDILQKAINNLGNFSGAYSKKWLCDYYISHGYYMQAIFFFNKNETKKVKEKLDIALKFCDTSLVQKNDFVDGMLLKANILRLQKAINPRMMLNMTEIDQMIDRAILLEKDNPRIYLSKGLYYFFSPPLQGGNTDSAKYYLHKSDSLFTTYKPISLYHPNWGHEQVYAWLGQVALREGKTDMAKNYYKKALELNPNYYWVSNQLIPELDGNPLTKMKQLKSIIIIMSVFLILFLGFILYNSFFKKRIV